jgi:hypothetical protein
MNRTKTLLATVTTSILLTSASSSTEALSSAIEQTVPTKADPWKTDPEVGNAAKDILAWLKETWNPESCSADFMQSHRPSQTNDTIRKQFPRLKPTMVDDALRRLVYEKNIKTTGDGSEAKPYRYYDRNCSGG